MAKEFVVEERIDRNGTKHQVVNTNCSRCGGAGALEMWRHTGKTCYKCGGSGRELEKRKIYTPEHQAKLDTQRAKRAEKKRQEMIANAGEENKIKMADWGYGQEHIYVVLGETFSIKEELKSKGARFHGQFKSWFFTEALEGYEYVELKTSELVWYNDLGQVYRKESEEVRDYFKAEKKKLYSDIESKHVGTAGEKIEVELKVVASFWLESYSYYGSSCINKMMDEDGNIFIWKTGKNLEHDTDENGKIKLKGTIKEHGEYKEEKQTVLTRCRVVA